MKIRIQWDRTRWKAHGDAGVYAFGRTLESTFRDLEKSMDAGIRYRGLEPTVKTEPRDVRIDVDENATAAVERVRAADAALAQAEHEAQNAIAESVRALTRAGVGFRDIARIVGRSRSRVQEIAAALSPRGSESVRSTGRFASPGESELSGGADGSSPRGTESVWSGGRFSSSGESEVSGGADGSSPRGSESVRSGGRFSSPGESGPSGGADGNTPARGIGRTDELAAER